MLGLVATLLVVSQMALLAMGYDPIVAMLIGGLASILWIGYAVRQNDRWILAVIVVQPKSKTNPSRIEVSVSRTT